MSPRRRLNVFVSYSHEDSSMVSPIVRLLAALPNDVFIDSASIEPGTHWSTAISGAILRADVVLVFWCSHSKESPWVRSEWSLGLKLHKRIMPLLLDDTELPKGLGRFQGIDFRSLGSHGPRSQLHAIDPVMGLVMLIGVAVLAILAMLLPKRWLRWLGSVWERMSPPVEKQMADRISRKLDEFATEESTALR
jgi:hypothetical protein